MNMAYEDKMPKV